MRSLLTSESWWMQPRTAADIASVATSEIVSFIAVGAVTAELASATEAARPLSAPLAAMMPHLVNNLRLAAVELDRRVPDRGT